MAVFRDPWGSAETQATSNVMAEGAFGDVDGWVRWIEHRPARDLPVEILCENGGVQIVTPRNMPEEWNVANVKWRNPR